MIIITICVTFMITIFFVSMIIAIIIIKLGVWITFDDHFTEEVAEREASAWRRVYALRQLLCDNNVALKCRLRLLKSCVVSLMYWCAHAHNVHILRAVQGRMMRKMRYVPRPPDESAETHMTRWAKLLRYCRAKHKLPHGDELYFASFFSQCGHIARITTRDPKKGNKQVILAQDRSEGFPRTRITNLSCACDSGRGPVSVGAFFFLLSFLFFSHLESCLKIKIFSGKAMSITARSTTNPGSPRYLTSLVELLAPDTASQPTSAPAVPSPSAFSLPSPSFPS